MKKIALLLVFLFAIALAKADNDELKYIGMPVGGICAGQVYLGGDGQLWYWDIFNVSMLNPGNEGGHRYYENPLTQEQKFANGFGIDIRQGDRHYMRKLNKNGFKNITFKGKYPMGEVIYSDKQLPVDVVLKAFSPFIPTDVKNSSLPVTVMEYTVKNTSDTKVEVALSGWLQNVIGTWSKKDTSAKLQNKIVATNDFTQLLCSSDSKKGDTTPDFGTMALTYVGKGDASANLSRDNGTSIYAINNNKQEAEKSSFDKLIGGVGAKVTLEKGEQKTFTFLLSWCFPNIHLWDMAPHWKNRENLRNYYTTFFNNASQVADYVIKNKEIVATTKKWVDTWYDSTLPKWFLDRTFLNVSTLATTASVRFNDLKNSPESEGRFYTFEGVNLGEGTCTHVFHYEQALGRVFPALAKQLRTQTDLGLSYKKDGVIAYRGEFSALGRHDGRGCAIDGQAGTILRIYREYLMSNDDKFLLSNWYKIKNTIQLMINQDKAKTGKADGILEGVQYNTLDRMWYGKIAWISGLYAAAVKAGAAMAKAVNDKPFAKKCDKIVALASKNISNELFNGEYFIQKLDAKHPEAPNSNKGCHTDQLLGQYWAFQTGLGYILPKDKVKKALKSIMKYNFVDNYGNYLDTAKIPVKRFYADKNEKGIIMCTFPKGGAKKAPGVIKNDWEMLVVGYFSEMWTGQEHQLAATLLDVGMVDEALKVERAVHNRYSPEKRNPYNEIEYGNHYTRAMSGYAPFISAEGFTYNGVKGVIGFSPKINSDNFKAAFIAAKGWGTFQQTVAKNKQTDKITVEYGELRLSQLNFKINKSARKCKVKLLLNGVSVAVKTRVRNNMVEIKTKQLLLAKGDTLESVITL